MLDKAKYTYTNKYTYSKYLADQLSCAKVFKVIYEQKTYFFTLSVVSDFAFFSQIQFFLSIDDPNLNSSFLLQFVESIMRTYHSSNQHKHFNKPCNQGAAPLFSTIEKTYLTFYDTSNIRVVRIARCRSCFQWNTCF